MLLPLRTPKIELSRFEHFLGHSRARATEKEHCFFLSHSLSLSYQYVSLHFLPRCSGARLFVCSFHFISFIHSFIHPLCTSHPSHHITGAGFLQLLGLGGGFEWHCWPHWLATSQLLQWPNEALLSCCSKNSFLAPQRTQSRVPTDVPTDVPMYLHQTPARPH